MPRRKRKRHVLAEYQKNNPWRLPRWRYDRVRGILDENERGYRTKPHVDRDDPEIVEAYQFLREWEAFNALDLDPLELEERRCEVLFDRNPGLYFAYQAFSVGQDDDVRYTLEAHILAGRDDKQIADKMPVMPEMARWYEKVFFNVRERLDKRSYITKQVISRSAATGLDRLTQDFSPKYFGYFGGPVVLDHILDGYDPSLGKPNTAEDFSKYYDRHVATNLRRRSAESVNEFEVNKFNVMQLFDTHARLMELAAASEKEGGAQTPLEETVSAVLGGIPWAVGTSRAQVIEHSPVKDYLGHAAEPRASELLLIASGEAPFDAAELANDKLPPPPKKEDTDA